MAINLRNLEDNDVFTVETRDVPPSHFLFKIQNFSSLSENGIDEYESTEFTAGEYKWKIIVYPNWQESGNDGDNVNVFLAVADTKSLPTRWEFNAVSTIFLYNQKSDNFLSIRGRTQRFHALNLKWGFCISKSSLIDPCNGYLVNDDCVFGAEVFIIKSQGVVECLSVSKVGEHYQRCLKIPQFSKLEKKWVSEKFLACDLNWKLEVHPRGFGEGKGCSISIFLRLVDSMKVKAKYTLTMKDQIKGKHCTFSGSSWFASGSDNCGSRSFMPISDMNDPGKGYLVKDCCIVEVEISVQATVHNKIMRYEYLQFQFENWNLLQVRRWNFFIIS
ncbi:hypothetical protein ACJIZ3_008715 [Penstemon smallii]|uniref:MATH domain-containing protein n=1 Tax=Penstemon smallii TaxID=265156 RepID=A0ABD3TAI8_9LAMI